MRGPRDPALAQSQGLSRLDTLVPLPTWWTLRRCRGPLSGSKKIQTEFRDTRYPVLKLQPLGARWSTSNCYSPMMKSEKSDVGSSVDSHRNEGERAASTPEGTPRKPKVTPSRAFVTPRKDTSGLKRHHTHPVVTTDRGKTTPGSTARYEEIQRALSLSSQLESPNTPTRSKHLRVVIISSDEEDATDIKLNVNGIPPTRSAFVQDEIPMSQTSLDSRFPHPIGSNIDSIGTSVSKLKIKDSNNTHLAQEPSVEHDLFNPVPRHHYSSADSSPGIPPLSQGVLRFARSPFGTDLEIMIIAHSRKAQQILDDNQIAWGVQYEIARGVCSGLWTWDGVESQVRLLKGRDSEAAFKVEKVMRGRNRSKPSDMHIWRQLDLEQDAILENVGRGLGVMGDFKGVRDWYGGKIQQIGRVVKDGSSYKIKLEMMESRRSHRFARSYGSRRFLHIRVPEDLLRIRKKREEVKRFFRRRFVLCGRVFVAFHAKEKNVYLVETDQNYERRSEELCGDHLRKSFNNFINWHNPLEVVENTRQVITKYTARFALGLSNSKPALEFEEKNILYINDITAEDWPQGEKGAPADKLMTDGCGFLNHTALQGIVQTVGYDSIPAGIQGRIGGSKGFFILHPTDTSTEPKIWIRDSQKKIQHKDVDRAQRILDLLCASQPSPPAALTQQSILNLFANGVNAELLVRLMEQGLEEEVAPLLQWDKPHATLYLHDAISKCGGVSGVRTQRIAYSLNRVLGFTGRDWHDDDGLNQEDDDDDDADAYTGRNEYSGAPFSLHEVAMELLQSGFDPRENKLLQEKISYIMDVIIKASVEKYRIPLPESAMSFIVPDPLGILEEGQVFYRFSRPRKDPETDLLQYALEGQILIGRYPIRLPSDIQRVNAVYKRELDRWPDVLVVSVKGKRSLANLLADGDMDGDEAIIIYDQMIVNLFKNRKFTQPPVNFMTENFNRDVESVEQFCNRISGVSTRHAHESFQDVLVSNLSESTVGLYSMMHENACKRYGYDSSPSIRLAYVFATLLDSSKNGCRLKDELFERDLQDFGSNSSVPYDIGLMGKDILAMLKSAGKRKGTELQQKYRDLGQIGEWDATDETLLAPILNVDRIALKYSARGFKDYMDEKVRIERHVDAACQEHRKTMRAYRSNKDSQEPPNKSVKKSRKEKQGDLMLQCAKMFAEGIPGIELIQNVEEVKAACAYHKDPKFAFNVAFRRLCLLKAESKGLTPSLRIFDEAKKVSPSFLKALEWAEEDHLESVPPS